MDVDQDEDKSPVDVDQEEDKSPVDVDLTKVLDRLTLRLAELFAPEEKLSPEFLDCFVPFVIGSFGCDGAARLCAHAHNMGMTFAFQKQVYLYPDLFDSFVKHQLRFSFGCWKELLCNHVEARRDLLVKMYPHIIEGGTQWDVDMLARAVRKEMFLHLPGKCEESLELHRRAATRLYRALRMSKAAEANMVCLDKGLYDRRTEDHRPYIVGKLVEMAFCNDLSDLLYVFVRQWNLDEVQLMAEASDWFVIREEDLDSVLQTIQVCNESGRGTVAQWLLGQVKEAVDKDMIRRAAFKSVSEEWAAVGLKL
jgi:hypothetical protein